MTSSFSFNFSTLNNDSIPVKAELCSSTVGNSALGYTSGFVVFLAFVGLVGQLTLLRLLTLTGGSIPTDVKSLFINGILGWTLRFVLLTNFQEPSEIFGKR